MRYDMKATMLKVVVNTVKILGLYIVKQNNGSLKKMSSIPRV